MTTALATRERAPALIASAVSRQVARGRHHGGWAPRRPPRFRLGDGFRSPACLARSLRRARGDARFHCSGGPAFSPRPAWSCPGCADPSRNGAVSDRRAQIGACRLGRASPQVCPRVERGLELPQPAGLPHGSRAGRVAPRPSGRVGRGSSLDGKAGGAAPPSLLAGLGRLTPGARSSQRGAATAVALGATAVVGLVRYIVLLAAYAEHDDILAGNAGLAALDLFTSSWITGAFLVVAGFAADRGSWLLLGAPVPSRAPGSDRPKPRAIVLGALP